MCRVEIPGFTVVQGRRTAPIGTCILVVQELEEEGFGVKITDGGIIAHLGSRTPNRHEIVDAVPELEGSPMERVEEGVFIQVSEESFVI